MKKLLYATFFLAVLTLSGCFKDYEERYLFTDNRVEFDAAVVNPSGSGVTFPWLTPLNYDAGVVRYRVNMTGVQSNVDRTVNFRMVPDRTTAREGIDFRFPNGTSFTIPANSSFGWVEVEVLPDGSGSPRIVLELLPTGDIKVMDRYHQIGLQILFPSTPPPSVEELNDIRLFEDITFGSSSNQNVGNYIDLHTGYAYIRTGGDANQSKIDLLIMRSGTGTEHNFLAPAATGSAGVRAWTSSAYIDTEWTDRNDGDYLLLPEPSSVELDLFENAQTRADLDAAYDYYFNNLTDRPNYHSYHGPGRRIRNVQTGDLVAFRSSTRDLVAILKVEESVPGSTGHISGDLKSGGTGE